MKRSMRAVCAALAALTTAVCLFGCASKEDTNRSEIRYNYDLGEYVRLSRDDYMGIPLQNYDVQVTDEEIAGQVLLARSNYADSEKTTDPAALHDVVNIDYVGYTDGNAFDGGTGEDYDLTLGSGSFIDGFESGLIGVKAGETRTLELRFPDPYPKDMTMSGAPVRFDVKVNCVYHQVLPDYTDDFVKEKYGYDTIAAFEEALRNALSSQKQSAAEFYRIQQVWAVVQEKAEILKFPQKEYDNMLGSYTEYYTALAQQDGISLNEYAQKNYGYSVSELNEWLSGEVRSFLTEEMILYYIARQENITLSDEEYRAGVMKYAKNYGLNTVQDLEAYFDVEDLRQNVLFDKVLAYLVDHASVAA